MSSATIAPMRCRLLDGLAVLILVCVFVVVPPDGLEAGNAEPRTNQLTCAVGTVKVRDARTRKFTCFAAGVGNPVAVASRPSRSTTEESRSVQTEAELREAWSDPRTRAIVVEADLVLRACAAGDPQRESAVPIVVDGAGHTLRQSCFEHRLFRQDGTGHVQLRNIKLTRGGSDGPGGAVTTRGEITVVDSTIQQNLAEEPGGGIFSMRRATIVRSVISGNLANDDGGGVYARRGGVQVYDSVLSNNLVDGSGGAIGTTGDILLVRSHVDGNTTDGDGGALYADEDGDVTIVDSTVDGNTADGPGGAVFTLDGDVTVVRSTLNGNRADDRGGAIAGEADVFLFNSTITHNSADAHVGGGVWARGNLVAMGSTVAHNFAEGQGGGLLAAGTLNLSMSTVIDNEATMAPNIGSGGLFTSFGSIIGPGYSSGRGDRGEVISACRVGAGRSAGYNLVADSSCGLAGVTDQVAPHDLMLDELSDNGGIGQTRSPAPGSPAVDAVPVVECVRNATARVNEGKQHLEGIVDLPVLLIQDGRGDQRPAGQMCDAGAVEMRTTR